MKKINNYKVRRYKMYKTVVIEYSPKADDMAKKFANGGEEAKQSFIEVVNRLGKMDNKVSQSIAGVDLFGTMWEDLGPTVITSFSKMDNGISKSSDSMQQSIDKSNCSFSTK